MDKVNLNAIKEHVNVKYGDLTGVIKIDGHSNISSVYELCKEYKFDTKDKFIIGFGLHENTIDGIGKRETVECSVLYVKTEEYGNSFDKIELKVKSEDTINTYRKTIYVKYSDLGKYIKRYDFLVMTSIMQSVKSIEINHSE